MATSLTATVTSSTLAKYQSTQALSTTFSGKPYNNWARNFATTDISKCYFNTHSVTTSPTSLDLTALTDAYGAALSFATVKHLQIINNSDTNSLTVGGGTNGLFTTLPFTLAGYAAANNGDDGSCLQLTTSITVDGTHKILTLTASAGTIDVDVFVLGS